MAKADEKRAAEIEPDAALTAPADTLDAEATAPVEVVRYNGFHFEERIITAANWKAVGIEHDAVTWDAANNWTVARSDLSFLSDEQFHNIIMCDGKFSLEEIN